MGLAELQRVQALARERAQAAEALHEAIYRAWQAGHSTREIAAYAGLSHQRVHQIVKEKRAEP